MILGERMRSWRRRHFAPTGPATEIAVSFVILRRGPNEGGYGVADSCFVYIDGSGIPDRDRIHAFVEAEGLDLTIHGEWPPDPDEGIVAMMSDGAMTGCEIFAQEPADFDDATRAALAEAGLEELDQGFELVFGTRDEEKAASVLAFALARLCKGGVAPHADMVLTGNVLRSWLDQALAERESAETVLARRAALKHAIEATGDIAGALNQRLSALAGARLGTIVHGGLHPDLDDVIADEMPVIPGVLMLEFPGLVMLSSSSWQMTSGAGLDLDATRTATQQAALLEAMGNRDDAEGATRALADRKAAQISDHLCLCKAVAALEAMGDRCAIAAAHYVAPDRMRLEFADADETRVDFLGTGELLAAVFRDHEVEFHVMGDGVKMR